MIIVGLLISSKVKTEDKTIVWVVLIIIVIIILVLTFFATKDLEFDMYDVARKIRDKESEIGIGTTKEDFKNFQCYELTNDKYLFYFPLIPIQITWHITKGICGRVRKTIDDTTKSIEGSKLASAILMRSNKDSLIDAELEKRGLMKEE